MNVTKKIIKKEIANNVPISSNDSHQILEKFIYIIKRESKDKIIKISGFGTFYNKKTVKRTGRNPKTKESYIIYPMKKLLFKASSKIRGVLN